MESRGQAEKVKSRFWKILSIAIGAFVAFIVIAFIVLSAYVNSDSFKAYVERILEKELGKDVSFKAFDFSVFSGIKLSDFAVSERTDGKDNEPLLILPSAEVSVSPIGLIQGCIDGITLTEPKIFIRLKKKGADAKPDVKRAPQNPLPITLKHFSVEKAEVVLMHPDGINVAIGPIDVALDDVGGGKSKLEVSGRLKGMEGDLKLSSIVDMQRLSLESGNIGLGEIDLALLPRALLKKITKDKMLKGIAASSVNITAVEKGNLEIEFIAKLKGAGFHSSPPLEKGATGDLKLGAGIDSGGPDSGLNGDLRALLSVPADFKSAHARIKAFATTNAGKGRKGDSHELSAEVDYEVSSDAAYIKEFDFKSTLLGKVALKGKVSGMEGRDGNNLETDVELGLSKFSLNGISGLFSQAGLFGGEISGRIKANGRSNAIDFTTDLKISDFSLTSAGKIAFDLSGRPIAIKSKGQYASAKNGKSTVRLANSAVSVDGLGLINISGGTDDIRAGLPGINAKLTMADTPVDALLTLAGKKDLAQKNNLHGMVRSELLIGHDKNDKNGKGKAERLSGALNTTFTHGGFSSPEGEIMAEGMALNIKTDFSYAPGQKTITFDTRMATETFEFLYGRFYGDFSKKPVKLALSGEYAIDSKTLKLADAEASIDGVGKAAFNAIVKNSGQTPLFDAVLKLDVPSLSNLYDFFIRDTFKESSAMLGRLSTAGAINLNVETSGTPALFTAKGDFILSNGDIDAGEEGPRVKGLEIAVPFDITYPEAGVSDDSAGGRFGLITVKTIEAGGIRLEALRLEPTIYRNKLRLQNDLAVPLYGGTVRVRDLVYDRLLSKDRTLAFTADIDSLDLRQIAEVLALPPFGGDITGTIPSAIFKAGSLSTEGEIALKLFNGEVRVTNIAVENVLSPIASIKSSIALKGIDLGQVTEAFEFGRITGVIGGYVNDLVITDGEPESFIARLETVKTRGIPQEISVTALNKISVFGSGGVGGALNRGIYRMFKEYRYSKMGFSGSLKNDTFTLNGIETTNGKGYLVKGGSLPPMVDVVTYNQKISFKEMVERLKRVAQTE